MEGKGWYKEKDGMHFKVPFRTVRGWVLQPEYGISTRIRKVFET